MMSKADDIGASQCWERATQPALRDTNWEQAQLPPQVKLSSNIEDVSPRSKGAIPLNDRQKDELSRKLEDVKAKASPSFDMHTIPSGSSRPPLEQPASCAPTTAPSKQYALNSVSPELLIELRKIIREEFETLKGDTQAKKEDVVDKPSRPPTARERPSSPVQPFINAAGVFVHSYPMKDTNDTAGSASTSSPTKPSLTKGEPKELPKATTVRFSDETKPAVPITPRVEESRKTSTGKNVEMTTIDMRWGVLFEKDGTHTKRMEHVVRGLANYIVEEFMPQRSIVIPPEKMAALYSHHRLEKETFPFATLFKAKSKDLNGALGSLYEDLGCQYFLVQADDRSRHTLPALTPQGFMQWLITMIQAYPDEEARRLDKIVSALPLEADSLLDGKPERLPKQISRYLLPNEPVRKMRRLVDEAVNDFREDIEGSAPQLSKPGSKQTPIVVTATTDKRASTSTAATGASRYVPDKLPIKEPESASNGTDSHRRPSAATKDLRDDDKHRRHSMPPPPAPSKTPKMGSAAEHTRSSQSSSHAHKDFLGRTPSSASTRKNRSPQRNPYTQSAPTGVDRDDGAGGERIRSSANISAAAANVAASVLWGASGTGAAASAQTPAKEPPGKTMKDTRHTDYFGAFRSKRASLEEQTMPRASASVSRDKADTDSSGTSRSSKRRSMVLPDVKRPTWDDYLKHSAPRSATPGSIKKTFTG